jgi:hypothetical protein
MKLKHFLLGAGLALAAVTAAPAMAQTYVLDTGTPTVTTGDPILSNAGGYAEEFTLAAGQTIDQVGVDLNLATGNAGTLTFALYSGSTLGRNPTALATWTTSAGSFVNGWNTLAASYTSATGGTFWIGVLGTAAGATYTAPLIANTATEPVAALGYAYTTTGNSSKQWTASSSYPIGLEVQVAASPAPEPESVALMALGLLVTMAVVRRQRGR